MENKRSIGESYEKRAVQILEEEDYLVLERNYRSRRGEIDIIARKGKILVFLEIKYRKNQNYGLGKEAISPKKMQTIFQVAQQYIQRNHLESDSVRMDCIHFLGEDYEWEQDIAWGDEIGYEMF